MFTIPTGKCIGRILVMHLWLYIKPCWPTRGSNGKIYGPFSCNGFIGLYSSGRRGKRRKRAAISEWKDPKLVVSVKFNWLPVGKKAKGKRDVSVTGAIDFGSTDCYFSRVCEPNHDATPSAPRPITLLLVTKPNWFGPRYADHIRAILHGSICHCCVPVTAA